MSELTQKIEQCREVGKVIIDAMGKEISRSGFNGQFLPQQGLDSATFSAKKDPFSQEETLEGEWRNARGEKCGSILFHGDGSFYAEYDIVQPHPSRKQWFVESVTAWGKGDIVKSELKLLPVSP